MLLCAGGFISADIITTPDVRLYARSKDLTSTAKGGRGATIKSYSQSSKLFSLYACSANNASHGHSMFQSMYGNKNTYS